MLDTVSVFEVMEAEDQEHRTSSRKALALAKVRVDNSLGRFLRAAQSEEEFEERLALVSEDFTHIVANSSTEVGHEHPEHIASALKDHYHLLSKVSFDFPSMDFRSGAANNPSDQDSDSSHLVSCPQCGGDGKTANQSDCGKCHGKGKVPNFGDSMIDALSSTRFPVLAESGNTDLGGPEPKMDKGKWTPTNPKKYKDDSKQHPTIEKDIIEPIKAVNDSERKEIGEKTTETVDLPSEKENSGFQTGGEDKGDKTDTWHGKDGQEDPVTRKVFPDDKVVEAAFARI